MLNLHEHEDAKGMKKVWLEHAAPMATCRGRGGRDDTMREPAFQDAAGRIFEVGRDGRLTETTHLLGMWVKPRE